jgi:hypothetical protein
MLLTSLYSTHLLPARSESILNKLDILPRRQITAVSAGLPDVTEISMLDAIRVDVLRKLVHLPHNIVVLLGSGAGDLLNLSALLYDSSQPPHHPILECPVLDQTPPELEDVRTRLALARQVGDVPQVRARAPWLGDMGQPCLVGRPGI